MTVAQQLCTQEVAAMPVTGAKEATKVDWNVGNGMWWWSVVTAATLTGGTRNRRISLPRGRASSCIGQTSDTREHGKLIEPLTFVHGS